MFRQFIIQVQNQFMRICLLWNKHNGILLEISLELLSFHTMQFHIWVNYYGSIQINSHPFTSLFPINMIFECPRLVPFSGLCTQQIYNSVNYFLKKTHLTIKWPSFFPLSRKYGGVKVSKPQQTFRVWSWFPCRCNIRSDHTNDVPLYFWSAWNASPYKLI